MEKMGGMEKAYIVFSSDNIMDPYSGIEKIGNEIRSSRLVSKVSWKISDETRIFLKDVYARKAPLLLTKKRWTNSSGNSRLKAWAGNSKKPARGLLSPETRRVLPWSIP